MEVCSWKVNPLVHGALALKPYGTTDFRTCLSLTIQFLGCPSLTRTYSFLDFMGIAWLVDMHHAWSCRFVVCRFQPSIWHPAFSMMLTKGSKRMLGICKPCHGDLLLEMVVVGWSNGIFWWGLTHQTWQSSLSKAWMQMLQNPGEKKNGGEPTHPSFPCSGYIEMKLLPCSIPVGPEALYTEQYPATQPNYGASLGRSTMNLAETWPVLGTLHSSYLVSGHHTWDLKWS